MNPSLRIEKLQRAHSVEGFDCGQEALNRFLIRYALQNQQAGASQTYVALSSDEVIGFYTLVVGQVDYADAPERLTKGLARRPVPIMLLARLATALASQGKGIGSGLLKDAMLRTLQAADIAGIRAFAVHAKDKQARAFYERFDLIASPTDPFHLFILLKDVRAALQKS
jgi:GNAT superfamily N-acetyltransferase